jgi:hypothetical protein
LLMMMYLIIAIAAWYVILSPRGIHIWWLLTTWLGSSHRLELHLLFEATVTGLGPLDNILIFHSHFWAPLVSSCRSLNFSVLCYVPTPFRAPLIESIMTFP